jgi:hypothetical protein
MIATAKDAMSGSAGGDAVHVNLDQGKDVEPENEGHNATSSQEVLHDA